MHDYEYWLIRMIRTESRNHPAIPREIRFRKVPRINCRAIINLRRHNARNNC